MNIKLNSALLLVIVYVAYVSSASINNGKYTRKREALHYDEIVAKENYRANNQYANNDNSRQSAAIKKSWQEFRDAARKKGQYVPSDDSKYIHVPDNRELGKYVHIPFPYDGGYGPYSGSNIPYEYDPAGQYSFEKYHTTKPPTTTTTTPRPPRRIYDDEGKWKIIRQNETKQEKKYEYLYETENGIMAEEQAVIGKNQTKNGGTSGKGFYQYIGDDDRIYRVEYTVGEQGYMPKLYIMNNPNKTKSNEIVKKNYNNFHKVGNKVFVPKSNAPVQATTRKSWYTTTKKPIVIKNYRKTSRRPSTRKPATISTTTTQEPMITIATEIPFSSTQNTQFNFAKDNSNTEPSIPLIIENFQPKVDETLTPEVLPINIFQIDDVITSTSTTESPIPTFIYNENPIEFEPMIIKPVEPIFKQEEPIVSPVVDIVPEIVVSTVTETSTPIIKFIIPSDQPVIEPIEAAAPAIISPNQNNEYISSVEQFPFIVSENLPNNEQQITNLNFQVDELTIPTTSSTT